MGGGLQQGWTSGGRRRGGEAVCSGPARYPREDLEGGAYLIVGSRKNLALQMWRA